MRHINQKVWGQWFFVLVAILALTMGGCRRSPEDALADFRATADRMGDSWAVRIAVFHLSNKRFAAADEDLVGKVTPETWNAYQAYRAAVIRTGRDGSDTTPPQTKRDDGEGFFNCDLSGSFFRFQILPVAFWTLIAIVVLGILGSIAGGTDARKKKQHEEFEAIHRQIEETRVKRKQ